MNQIQVPEGWKLKKLDDISEVKRGISWSKNQESKSQEENSIAVLRIGNIRERYLDLSDILFIRDLKPEVIEKSKVSKDDILLVGSNGNRNFVGRSCKIDKKMDFVFASFLMGVSQILKEINPDFLLYYLNSPQGWNYIRNSTSTGVGINNLKISKLREMPITYPEKEIQEKICQKLNYILKQFEEKKKIIFQLQNKNKNISIQLKNDLLLSFIKKLIPLTNLPNNWILEPLSEVCVVERGKFGHRPRNDPDFYGGKYPFIQTGDVARSNGRIKNYTQTLNDKGLKVSRMFPKGTVVITIAANIGDTAIIEFDSCFPDSIIGITPIKGKTIPEYIEYVLRLYKHSLNLNASTGAQKNINYGFLKPLKIPVPKSITTQKEIVKKIEDAEKEIDKISLHFKTLIENQKNTLNHLEHLQNSIFEKAFSGKLVN